MKSKKTYILRLTAFLVGSSFANALENASSGKEMEVGLVVYHQILDASTPERLGPADPAAASRSLTVPHIELDLTSAYWPSPAGT